MAGIVRSFHELVALFRAKNVQGPGAVTTRTGTCLGECIHGIGIPLQVFKPSYVGSYKGQNSTRAVMNTSLGLHPPFL